MHTGYDPAAWESFCVAMVGAAAALTGLLFVAVSINLDNILKSPKFLPPRAAETLATLLIVLVSCALALVPQNTRLLGIELAVIALSLLVRVIPRQLATQRQQSDDPATWHRARIATTAAAAVPAAIAGVSLVAHWGGGLYWLVPTALLGIAAAVYSAWVLLVEILI
jgi:modulator of FtsH protease